MRPLNLIAAASLLLTLWPAPAQIPDTNSAAFHHHPVLPPATPPTTATNRAAAGETLEQRAERIRTECINGRRRICGRILEIVPEGLVVDSGYTNLLRPELARSWVARSNITTSKPANLVEEHRPGALCVGLVFVTDIPKKPKAQLYDYVILQGYPAGDYLYRPVPNVNKTLRRFSVGLLTATRLRLQAEPP
jgi:hypothetical protein